MPPPECWLFGISATWGTTYQVPNSGQQLEKKVMIISTILQQAVILTLQFLFKNSSEIRATVTNQLLGHFFSSCIIFLWCFTFWLKSSTHSETNWDYISRQHRVTLSRCNFKHVSMETKQHHFSGLALSNLKQLHRDQRLQWRQSHWGWPTLWGWY